MTKFNSKHKALSALGKLGAVALITATTLALLFAGCKQTGTGGSGSGGGNSGGGNGGGDKPKPSTPNNYSIAFSVDSTTPNGTLKAKADGIDETDKSPISVEEGKTITFTATPKANYAVLRWELDGRPITEAGTNTEYTHKVTKEASIKVFFEIPSVKDGAVLILSSDKLTFSVTARTKDNSDITVEGCNEATLSSGMPSSLTAKAGTTKVVLKGNIIELDFRGGYGDEQPLTFLNVRGLTALQKLSCSYTKLTSLDVQGLTSLQELNCDENKLATLNVQGCTSLKELVCYKNELTTLDAHGLTSLQELKCNENKLTALNVQGCTALKELACYKNELTTLDAHGLPALQTLDCSKNKLTALNVQGCTALKELNCSSNKLSTLTVQGLTTLEWLDCGGNQLPELNVQGLTALKVLNCYINQLTSLDVKGLTALIYLYCYANKLNADAFKKLFTDLPQREKNENAVAILYTEQTDIPEGNYKDFTTASEVKTAFDNAKGTKHWKMQKKDASGNPQDI